MDREDVLPTPPTGTPLPTVLVERYRLDRSLGNGGMGEVFEATDLTLHRSVAVKLMSPSLVQDEPARARFLRAARALAQVNSPNVVAVYDAGEDAERPFSGDAVSLVYQHVHSTPPRVDSLVPTVPAELGALVAGLMAKDPGDRPASAEEVQRALGSVPTEPIAPTTSTATAVLPRRAQELRQRRKPWWPMAAGIVGVVALLALLIALLAGGDPRPASSPTQRSSTTPSSPSSSPSTVVSQTPKTAGAALLALTQQLQDAGAIDHKLASDIQHAVTEVVNGHGHGHEGDAGNTLSDLKDKISEAVDHGTLSAADGRRLTAAIDRLEQTLASE